MTDQDYFMIYANCIPVKGAARSIICDLHRGEFEIIPNVLFEMLTQHKDKNIGEIKALYGIENSEIIDDYFSFLEQQEFIYSCSPTFLSYFPEMNVEWQYPALVTNAIFDCNTIPEYVTTKFVSTLDLLGCKHIQFRVFSKVGFSSFLKAVMPAFEWSGISTLEVQIPYEYIGQDSLKALLLEFTTLTEIVFFDAPDNKIDYVEGSKLIRLVHVQKNIASEQHCGLISEKYFAINIPAFTESLHHNSCLNRKISIDVNGNIRDITLTEALGTPGFKKHWNITKDQISVCKDCEFRHICTDCRAYLEDPEDIYSKPLKCGYDPYTCGWEDWSTNPIKQKAMVVYGFCSTEIRDLPDP